MENNVDASVFTADESQMSEETKKLRAEIRSRYGENKKIEGDYDESLAAKCVNGTFIGKMNGDVLEYKGIPFVGEQPEGKNRFKKPVPYKADDGVYEAYYNGKTCPQPETPADEGSLYYQGEDCLYVNIFNNTKDPNKKKPVMFWIHGGAWEHGGTADPFYDGHNFVEANPDVIFVTTSYRVNLFGFMDLSHLPGGEEYPDSANAGVLDIVMALKWVNENISAFGGDPECVTVFGQSAGGGNTSDILLIEEARKYFQRAIPLSGSCGITRTQEAAQDFTEKAFELMNIKTIDELVNLPAETIVQGSLAKPLCTYPMRGSNLLPKDPYSSFGEGVAKDIDILQGSTKDENAFFCYAMDGNKENYINLFTLMFEGAIANWPSDLAEKTRKYFESIPGDMFAKITRFFSQFIFTAPAIRQSEEMVKGGGKVYHYYYRVESSLPDMGAMHSVELTPLLNNLDVTVITGRRIDETFARTMQRMFVNFAKTGNPSLTAEESPNGKAIEWEPYNSETKPVMVFDEFDIHMDKESNLDIIDWDPMYELTNRYMG